MMKRDFLWWIIMKMGKLIFGGLLCMMVSHLSAQNSYSLRLNLDSLDVDNKIACYYLEISNLGPDEWLLGGMDVSFLYDASAAVIRDDSPEIVDDQSMDYVLSPNTQIASSPELMTIPYYANLGFIRFNISANVNILSPKAFPPDGSWIPIVRFCMDILLDDITSPSTCLQMNFGNDEIYDSGLFPPDNVVELGFTEDVIRVSPMDLIPNSNYDACFILDEDTEELCDDGIDNDEDGLLDCLDPGCSIFCSESSLEACNDNIDNDNDGLIDCADDSCIVQAEDSFTLKEPSNCPDLNDGELTFSFSSQTLELSIDAGFTWQASETFSGLSPGDYEVIYRDVNTGCEMSATNVILTAAIECTEQTLTECSDGIDNDGDGLVDCQEDDCAGFDVCAQLEASTSACSDGIDNDNDGLTDCEDDGCRFFDFCQLDTRDLVYIPTAISRSSINGNDSFSPKIKNNQDASIISYGIYDRAGNKVFWRENLSSSDPRLVWRGDFGGDLVETGVYVYVITVDINGVRATFSGDITILN